MNDIEMKLNSKEFLAKLSLVKNPAQLESLFKEEDIELKDGVTYEQAFEGMRMNRNDELSESALEDVSGGGGFLLGAALLGGLAIFIKGFYNGIRGK